MTNSFNDIANSQCILLGGSNAAENHAIAMRYVVEAKEKGAKVICVDPRFTTSASKADVFAQIRPGTDIAYLGAIIKYIIENNHYDRSYLLNFTNALCKVNPDFKFEEGLFSGYNAEKRTYSTDTWTYVLDDQGQPVKSENLDDAGTVFSLLKDHFSRYTFAKAEEISGIPSDKIKEIADTMVQNRPMSILYAMGITQHTTGSQNVRCYTILQLLLGNIGKAGGAINALRGEPNVQGSSDFAELSHILPGYIPMPLDTEKDTTAYGMRAGSSARKHLISLLKAWFGSHATEENDYCFSYLPKNQPGKGISIVSMLEEAAQGQFKLLFNIGTDLMVSIANNQLVTAGYSKADMVVALDLWENETATFWKAPGVDPKTINTEVLLLPVAFWCEKGGSLSNSARWIQWKDAAVKPEGDTKPDLDIIDLIFKKVRGLYQGSTAFKDQGIVRAVWDYDHGHEADPEKVLKEINGYNDAEGGRLIKTLGEYLAAPVGTVSSGCWVYAGVFGNGNLSKRRDNRDASGLGLFPGWTYAWPANIRILYNRASCDVNGDPVDPKKALIWWDSLHQQWVGNDIPDIINRSKGPDTPEGRVAFRMTAERMGRLFAAKFADRQPGATMPTAVSALASDGPLPEHYEPIESPAINAFHPKVQNNPLAIARETLKDIQKIGKSDKFPYILTTNRGGAAHFCSGAVTRNIDWLNQLAPEPYLELDTVLAGKLGVKYGEMVEVSSARGMVKLKAIVTDRIQPLTISGNQTHVVNAPYGWGFAGLATGPSINSLTISAMDPAGGTPEYKACLCDIRKVK